MEKSDKDKENVKRLDPPEEERRKYLKTVGALVAGLAVGGAAGWLSKPAERVEVPGVTVTERITETVTKTVTAPITPTPPTPAAVTLSWWTHSQSEADAKFTSYIVEKYREKHPNVDFKIETMPLTEWYTKLFSAVAAGVGPDIFDILSEDIVTLKDLYEPIPNNISEKYLKGSILEDLRPEQRRWFTAEWYGGSSGNLIGFPKYAYTYGLLSNTEMAAEAGFDRPPANWNPSDGGEVVEWAEATTKWEAGKQTVVGFAVRHSGHPAGIWSKSGWAVYTNGGRYVDDETWETRLTQPEAIEGLQFLVDLIYRWKVSSIEFPAPDTAFTQEKAYMHVRGTYIVPFIRETAPELPWMVSIPPKNKEYGTRVSLCLFGIAQYSKHKDTALDFCEFMTSKENLLKYHKDVGGSIPFWREEAEDPFFKRQPYTGWIEGVPYGVVQWMPVEAQLEIGTAVSAAMYKEKTPKEAFAEVEPKVKKILTDYKKKTVGS